MENIISTPAIDYLNQQGVAFELVSFSPNTEKGAANVAEAFGFRPRQMVKTLIFESPQEAYLIMVGGDQNAISGLIKKVVGSRNISMCSPEKVKLITGYVIGSIPPFHWQPKGFRSFMDMSLMEEKVLGVGSGLWGLEIFITPDNLVRASRAQVVNLTVKENSSGN
jgi:Cys-tRNA(Pro)/Cys-tRNA(Cys) deacylase